jgi:hypothetical protein
MPDNIVPQAPPVIAPVVHAGTELTQPVIDVTQKVAHLEEQQRQKEEELYREIGRIEDRVRSSHEESQTFVREKLAALEAKLEALAAPVAPVEQVAQEVPETAVEMATPVIEQSSAPPEKVRRGIRGRRKAKRKGGKA